MADNRKKFRVHLKNGNSLSVAAHHFDSKFASGPTAYIPFYKDENELDADILIFVADVAAVVPLEDTAPVRSGTVKSF